MTEVNDKQVSTDAPAPQMPADQQPTGIQIADLQTILNIIDLASSRGAFRAPELTQVGAIADKLGAFLKSLADQEKAKAEAEAPAEAPAEAQAEEKKE
jgi:hypothetical protein|tara:strand:+ start:227 stop:520 length:294 start_codon:yes stop_codon:yes gene_type:complete